MVIRFRKNDDNTESRLPKGTSLDSATGEIAGRVPYQPAITEEYKFTVTAIRSGTESDLVSVSIFPFEDTQQGLDQVKIVKLSTDASDGLDDLQSLVNKKITINKGKNLERFIFNLYVLSVRTRK